MKQLFDLSSLDWLLTGCHPYFWVTGKSMELNMTVDSDVRDLPIHIPVSVQGALRDAGLIPDWNEQFHARDCEWLENRHWVFETTIPDAWLQTAGEKILICDGLDYQGVLLVNGKRAGTFCGAFTPHDFNISPFLLSENNRLAIIFTDNPRSLGQVGYTSTFNEMKPRFNYRWDWTPRLVQIGIWDSVHLEIRPQVVLSDLSVNSEYRAADAAAAVNIRAKINNAGRHQVEVLLFDDSGKIHQALFPAQEDFSAVVSGFQAKAWQPNGHGQQPLYEVKIRLLDNDGNLVDEETRRIGFKEIVWQACAGAPAAAEPWICVVNGTPIFLQGVNWTPIKPNFADVTETEYRQRLEIYRDMGLNILRVWGGAVLEREIFYRLCDEFGIMVWQEFPLSSSGLDNWPSEDATVIAGLLPVVTSYILRRQHHPSLLLWCGGNELQGANDGGKVGIGKPIGRDHPMMVAFAKTIAGIDPTHRFIPTSSSGPCFTAERENFGKGTHHDVHGPWSESGPLQKWYDYWDAEDSLFRSETGMPGAESAALIKRYGGEYMLPGSKENPWWNFTGGWWILWDSYLAEGGDESNLEEYVAWSQKRQADALAYAANSLKKRFPACGGLIIWMGHDCYPCPMNTSIVDYLGNPKPAVAALREVFTRK